MTPRDPSDSPLSPELIGLLRSDAADARDVERAYRRFAIHRDVVPKPARVGRWLAFGFAMGWGVVFAATGEPFPGYREQSRPSAPQPTAPAPKTPRSPGTPAPTASVEPEVPPASSAPRSPPVFSYPFEGDQPNPKWQRAARALRERDYSEAHAALDELERSENRADAEAASLALAQVLVAQGREREARGRLERLVASARSKLVRDKARALLLEIDAGDRSRAAPAATKSP
jgi:hypothetical protein